MFVRCWIDLDAGNSSLKWRVRKGDAILSRGRCTYSNLDMLERELVIHEVEGALVSCVSGIGFENELRKLLSRFIRGEAIAFAKATKQFGDELINAYLTPECLGIDRWLALLASRRKTDKDFCVVDCGTAITVDFVCAGIHCGGYISPGLPLLTKAVNRGTAAVRVNDGDFSKVRPGVSTSECVSRGVAQLFLGGIDRMLSQFSFEDLFLTGGDANLLFDNIDRTKYSNITVVPDLVLDGLVVMFGSDFERDA